MLTIDYDNLSDDPQVAFAQIVEQLDSQLQDIFERQTDDSDSRPAIIEYMNNVIAAADALTINEFAVWEVPSYKDPWDEYNKFSLSLKGFIIRTRINNSRITKIYSVALDVPAKTKIHHYIERIRAVIDASDLTDKKRNSLFAKLNSFAADVDRARTRMETAMFLLSDLADVAKRGTEAVKPLTDFVNSITALIGEAKSVEPEPEKLPAPRETKRIEGPKVDYGTTKRTEPDDEIPF